MLNKCIIEGRLTADPEYKQLDSNATTARFRLACSRNYKNQEGEYEADFIPVVCWNGNADFVHQRLAQGARIIVIGRWQVRTFNKDGKTQWSNELYAEEINVIDYGKPKKDK